MNSTLIIIDKAPYGLEDAFSAFYVAIACLNRNTDADVLLVGDGVYAVLEDQNPGETIKYPEVGELAYLIYPEGNIFVHQDSLEERGIETEELMEAVDVIDDDELYEYLESKIEKTVFIKI